MVFISEGVLPKALGTRKPPQGAPQSHDSSLVKVLCRSLSRLLQKESKHLGGTIGSGQRRY